jgi:hypothetical protein
MQNQAKNGWRIEIKPSTGTSQALKLGRTLSTSSKNDLSTHQPAKGRDQAVTRMLVPPVPPALARILPT